MGVSFLVIIFEFIEKLDSDKATFKNLISMVDESKEGLWKRLFTADPQAQIDEQAKFMSSELYSLLDAIIISNG